MKFKNYKLWDDVLTVLYLIAAIGIAIAALSGSPEGASLGMYALAYIIVLTHRLFLSHRVSVLEKRLEEQNPQVDYIPEAHIHSVLIDGSDLEEKIERNILERLTETMENKRGK